MSSSSSSEDPSLWKKAATTTTTIHQLNHAGDSPSSDATVARVMQHLKEEQIWGGYAAAAAVQDEHEQVYERVAQLIHAESPNEIALVESATVGWTRIFYAAAEHNMMMMLRNKKSRRNNNNGYSSSTSMNHRQNNRPSPPPPKSNNDKRYILVSQVEYAANLVAACQWVQRKNSLQSRNDDNDEWSVLMIPSEAGSTKTSVNALQQMLEGSYPLGTTQSSQSSSFLDPRSIAMICVTHIPTNSGIVNPVEELGALIAQYNNNNNSSAAQHENRIFYLVDACQSVGQRCVNVQTIQCDALVATGRKYLRGPRGTGFLYVAKRHLWDANPNNDTMLWPHHMDHWGVPVQAVVMGDNALQDRLGYAPRPTARRFEFWESNVAGRLGLGVAIQQALSGHNNSNATTNNAIMIRQRAAHLMRQLQSSWLMATDDRAVPLLQLHHPVPESGIVTFAIPSVNAASLVRSLLHGSNNDNANKDAHCFALSLVPATSTPLDATAHHPLIRASVSYTTTEAEIELFVQHLEKHVQRQMMMTDDG